MLHDDTFPGTWFLCKIRVRRVPYVPDKRQWDLRHFHHRSSSRLLRIPALQFFSFERDHNKHRASLHYLLHEGHTWSLRVIPHFASHHRVSDRVEKADPFHVASQKADPYHCSSPGQPHFAIRLHNAPHHCTSGQLCRS